MMKLTILKKRKLKSDDALASFQKKFFNLSGVELPLAYLKDSKIITYYNPEGHMVAGYLLKTKANFRLLDQIPPKFKENLPFDNNIVEVNGFFISPRVQRGRDNIYVWLNMLWDIYKCRKHFLLISSNAKNKTIIQYHTYLKPQLIYEGPPFKVEGKSFASLRYSYVKRNNVALALFRAYKGVIKRWKLKRPLTRVPA